MRSILALPLFAIVSLLSLSSCSDDDSESVIPEILIRPGTTWQYRVELGAVLRDTVDATVRVFEPGPAERALEAVAVWQISYDGHVDTSFVRTHENAVFIVPQDADGLRRRRDHYVFPLAVGKVWRGPECCDDSSKVEAVETIFVPAGEFETWRVERSVQGFNSQFNATAWIATETGIVRLEQFEYDLGFLEHRTWVLTAFAPGAADAVPEGPPTGLRGR